MRISESLSFYPLEKLGHGSHAAVFKGRFGKFNPRLVAVKLVDCSSEQEARDKSLDLIASNHWPCYFSPSDTSGEKDFEEFYTETEILNMDKFSSIGIIKNKAVYDEDNLNNFLLKIHYLRGLKKWNKKELIELFNELIPNFKHKETGKNLDEKM